VVSAVLLSHRLFLFPAFGPLIYNVFIILGGVIGGRHFGIASLAYGALVGSFVGPFLASVIGAARIGTGYRPSFDIANPAFREWVKLSVPLMLGVSLVTADDRILRHYAASGVGDISPAIYFCWLSLSLALWSAQGLYARAFYAAGDTLTPMVAVSVITAASLPLYSVLFRAFGVIGLAWASDIGIGVNLLALALLLHYKN